MENNQKEPVPRIVVKVKNILIRLFTYPWEGPFSLFFEQSVVKFEFLVQALFLFERCDLIPIPKFLQEFKAVSNLGAFFLGEGNFSK